MLPISRRRLASNAGSAILQVIVSGLTLFLLYRYLLEQLGSEILGVWSVVVASTSIARLSDFGLTGGVTKFVANYRVKGDAVAASDMVQTAALTIAAAVGLLGLLAMPVLVLVLVWAVPQDQQELARNILPWTLLSLWLNCIAGVFLAALDGCQRATHRNAVLMAGQLLFFGLALAATPIYGLRGVAMGQVLQAIFMLVVSWLLLRRELTALPALPMRWSRNSFMTAFSYAINFQIITLCVLLFDPMTKVLMGRFGGLSITAYYDMASQLILKARALLVSANQVMVPVVAEVQEGGEHRLKELYARAYEFVFVIALLAYAGLALLLPIIMELWIGRTVVPFLVFAYVLLGAYFINNLSVPAYFDNLGTGDIRSNVTSHVLMALVNGVFGLLLGVAFGGKGVAVAVAGAIVAGSLLILVTAHRKYGISNYVPRSQRLLTAVVLIVTSACLALIVLGMNAGLNLVGLSASGVVAFGSSVLFVFRKQPVWRIVMGYFKARAQA